MTSDAFPDPLRILQVSTHEHWGGAEAVAWNLFHAYRRRGLDAYLAVGYKRSDDPRVVELPHDRGRGRWYGFWRHMGRRLEWLKTCGATGERVCNIIGGLAEPARILDDYRGHECFRFPGTEALLELLPRPPDIVHAHNLHGQYFDLRLLPWLSRQVPVVLTLHDGWLLSGHCSQAFSCNRWQTGCGHCPDLSIYPPVRRDATALNWQRKQTIYAQSRVHVVTPSDWLMRRVDQSMLAPAVVDAQVIPNGVDLSIFKPADKRQVRRALGLPGEAYILLFVASGIRTNRFKDYPTLRTAVTKIAARFSRAEVILLTLGEAAEPEHIGTAEVRFVPFEPNAAVVAQYYQAADLYLHAARADTFPTTILEALACGTPVVATAVGGIAEQIKSLEVGAVEGGESRYAADEATGVLVAPGDAEGMAQAVVTLLNQATLCHQVAENAAQDACRRFDLNRQVEAYLAWYHTICARWPSAASRAATCSNSVAQSRVS